LLSCAKGTFPGETIGVYSVTILTKRIFSSTAVAAVFLVVVVVAVVTYGGKFQKFHFCYWKTLTKYKYRKNCP